MATVEQGDGFQLFGWMVTELHLSGGELLAFAVVRQFSQSNAGVYTGGTAYLAKWIGWTKKTARKHLQNLVAKGLIVEKHDTKNGVPCVYYWVGENLPVDREIIAAGYVKNSPRGREKNTPVVGKNLPTDNKIDNKGDNKEIVGEFVPPTYDEVKAYAEHLGYYSLDPDTFLDFYDTTDWHQNDGTPITNWKRAVANWKRTDKERGIDISRPIHKHVNYSDTLTQQWHTK